MRYQVLGGGVEIHRERLPREAKILRDRPDAMKVLISNFEDDRSVEEWLDNPFAFGRVLIPDFQLTTVLRFPVTVEINEHDEPSLQTGIEIHVPVGVHIE